MLSNHPSFKHVQSRGVLRETEEWFWSVTNDAPVLIWVSQGERETGSWTSFYPISLHVSSKLTYRPPGSFGASESAWRS